MQAADCGNIYFDMRFFIALEIPEENRLAFQAIQDRLHTLIPQARLTNLEKIHLTLAFVGEQPEELKELLIGVISKSVKGIPPFVVTPAYIDGFPNISEPQVLWVGTKGDIDKILLIAKRITEGLEDLNLPIDERRFIPHITIAKFNDHFQMDRQTESQLDKIMGATFNPIQISSIKLFESAPQNGLHKHHVLAEIKLEPISKLLFYGSPISPQED